MKLMHVTIQTDKFEKAFEEVITEQASSHFDKWVYNHKKSEM